MILLLGATGYVGQAFTEELRRRRTPFIPLSRRAVDYTQFQNLFDYLRQIHPAFVINAAGFVGAADGQEDELDKAAALRANTVFPQDLARACSLTNTPLGHVSSGAIFAGAKIALRSRFHVVRDLSRPRVRWLVRRRPDCLGGFAEYDAPNCTFRQPPCTFYAGTKAVGEELLGDRAQVYIWRPNVLFDDAAHRRNFLCGFPCSPAALDSLTSFSHRGDFVRACLDLWENSAPFGTYHIVNPGPLTPRQIIETVRRLLKTDRHVEVLHDGNQTGTEDATAPRSVGCVLDSSKLEACGVRLRPAVKALEDTIRKWRSMPNSVDEASWPIQLGSASGGRPGVRATHWPER